MKRIVSECIGGVVILDLTVKMNPCFKEVDKSDRRYIVMKGSA